MAWHADTRSSGRSTRTPVLAAEFVERLGHDLQDEPCPPKIDRVCPTLLWWMDQIVCWHTVHVFDAPTEAMNSLIKGNKRVGSGFREFAYYRTRLLFYADMPNWHLLTTVTSPLIARRAG